MKTTTSAQIKTKKTEDELKPTEKAIRILLIEDNKADAYLIETLLQEKENLSFEIIWSDRLEKGLSILKEKKADIILLDLSLPDSFGLSTFQKVADSVPHIPIVLLTGLNDESMALDVMRLGAQDYLIKGEIDAASLVRVIRYAIERKRSEEKIKKFAEELAESNQELKRFSAKLQEANEKLRHIDEMKTKFIAIASHELKTPLTIMKGFLGLLIDDHENTSPEAQREHLLLVKEATDRMRRLVDSLLDISKMELGHIHMKKQSATDVKKILEEAFLAFKTEAKKKNITIHEEFAPDLKQIHGDDDRLRQVVDNLISNALKYTPRGGSIWVRAKNLSHAIEITVKDTGIGIKEEDIQKIFEPFQHLRKSGLEGEDSTGLGLALVKKIVEAHGGKIQVRSSPGKGSVFCIYLPVSGSKEAS